MVQHDAENRSWDESRLHVNAELERHSEALANLRGGLYSLNLRLAVLEAKVVFYAAIGSGIVTFVVNYFFRG